MDPNLPVYIMAISILILLMVAVDAYLEHRDKK